VSYLLGRHSFPSPSLHQSTSFWIGTSEKFERKALLILDLMMTILVFIYVSARLFLIAQALALLRNQSPSAFVVVDWTKYAPHLFS